MNLVESDYNARVILSRTLQARAKLVLQALPKIVVPRAHKILGWKASAAGTARTSSRPPSPPRPQPHCSLCTPPFLARAEGGNGGQRKARDCWDYNGRGLSLSRGTLATFYPHRITATTPTTRPSSGSNSRGTTLFGDDAMQKIRTAPVVVVA
ncbi:hypothetical protein K438DRAFT_2016137 [Mycena galopus ATCC 62051]|nr:hypothetical protein K438DRAFT_2016137 [Mycena galopus ATCC 62051]